MPLITLTVITADDLTEGPMTNFLPALPNRHHKPLENLITENRYISVFENKYGNQVVISVDRQDRRGTVMHSDADWQPYPVSSSAPLPAMNLEEAEIIWLASCWIAILGLTGRKAIDLLSTMLVSTPESRLAAASA